MGSYLLVWLLAIDEDGTKGEEHRVGLIAKPCETLKNSGHVTGIETERPYLYTMPPAR